MLPFNDVRHVEYYKRHDFDQARLYRRSSILRELKLLRADRRRERQTPPAAFQGEMDPAPVG